VIWLTPLALAVPLGAVVSGAAVASADPGLSSIVISRALPGMVEAPSGPLNGPLTSSELNSLTGNSGATSALSQALASGDVSAYVRMWTNEPPNGAFVEVVAAQLPTSADASAALAGAEAATRSQGFGHFAVTEVPDSIGVTLVTNTLSGVVSEEIVQFAKGSILFFVATGQVTTAANSGAAELGEPDVIQIARHQAAAVPGPALAPSVGSPENTAYTVGEWFGAALLIAGAAGVAVFFVRRSGRRPAHAASSGGTWGSAVAGLDHPAGAFAPDGPSPDVVGTRGMAPSVTRTGAAVLERPAAAGPPAFHCTWCGDRVLVGSEIHDCGPRNRPAIYCMNCGTAFEAGATNCSSCGTRKLQ